MEKRTPFRQMNAADKKAYIADYLKWPIIAAVFTVIAVISIVKSIVTHRDPDFSVMMINSASQDTEAFDAFLAEQGIKRREKMTDLSAEFYYDDEGNVVGNYYNEIALIARLNGGGYDVFFGTGKKFEDFARQGFFRDLRQFVPADKLADIPKDHLIFCTPEGGGEEYPCAILFDNAALLAEYYPDTPVWGGVIFTCPHEELAETLINKLAKESF